jgi:hypothetical protein
MFWKVYFFNATLLVIKNTLINMSEVTFANGSTMVFSDALYLIFCELLNIVVIDWSPLGLFIVLDEVTMCR